MSICTGNHSFSSEELDSPKVNKYALKLLGVDNMMFTDEEILEFLSTYVQPHSINALIYDLYNNFYVVFLLDIESACLLVGKTLNFGAHIVTVSPLLDFFVINNVYPSVSNEDISDVFRTFGNVYEVKNYKVSPNSSKFSHILSGKREISFLLPGKEKEIALPRNVISLPYTFHVNKFCCACLTEGHSMLFCPDRDDTVLIQNCLPNDHEMNGESFPVDGKRDSITPELSCKEEANTDAWSCLESSKNNCWTQNETVPATGNNDLPSKYEESITEDVFFYKGNACDFVLTPDVEKLLQNSAGVLPTSILKNLLLMDGRNKKDILAYISKHTKDYQAVYDQIKELQLHCIQNESILFTVGQRLISKMVLLMNTLIKLKRKQT